MDAVRIIRKKVEKATKEHHTPWVKTWTLCTVEIPESRAEGIARKVRRSLTSKHNWYADFKNGRKHYIIFKHRIFRINRNSAEEYRKATEYGISIGIPAQQVDFSPHVRKWKRKSPIRRKA